MEVYICSDPSDVDQLAARVIEDVIQQIGSDIVLGFATGSSPMGAYEVLAERVRLGEVDLSQARAFALDEYVGLPPSDPRSYHSVVNKDIAKPLGMNPNLVEVPDGTASDLVASAATYDDAISRAGGVDLQILGLGVDGHIGFNEPASSFTSRTRLVTLTQQTRDDNSRFFESIDEVPRKCITQGLGTIMDARSILLVAKGESKAPAVAAVVEGPVSASCPGSILQFHPSTTVVVDNSAASDLRYADYYREAYNWSDRSQR